MTPGCTGKPRRERTMTDSELHEIENHISWGWHDDKGNDDVRLLFNEIMRLRAVAAEAREEGRKEGIEEIEMSLLGYIIGTGPLDAKVVHLKAERLRDQS